jgi:hypothetical protein
MTSLESHLKKKSTKHTSLQSHNKWRNSWADVKLPLNCVTIVKLLKLFIFLHSPDSQGHQENSHCIWARRARFLRTKMYRTQSRFMINVKQKASESHTKWRWSTPYFDVITTFINICDVTTVLWRSRMFYVNVTGINDTSWNPSPTTIVIIKWRTFLKIHYNVTKKTKHYDQFPVLSMHVALWRRSSYLTSLEQIYIHKGTKNDVMKGMTSRAAFARTIDSAKCYLAL